jgi:DNA-binding MarR family transcriptional regulator
MGKATHPKSLRLATTENTSAASVNTAVGLRVAVARIYRSLRARSDHQLTPSATSALARIAHGGPLRLGVLAQLEGIAPATMSKVVDNLETQRFIVRVPDVLDGRASLIELSDEGAALLHQIRSTSTRAIDQALASLSDTERSALDRAVPILEKLSELLQANTSSDRRD